MRRSVNNELILLLASEAIQVCDQNKAAYKQITRGIPPLFHHCILSGDFEMQLKKILLGAAMAVSVSAMGAGAASAATVFVGSWHVGDGALWTTNPTVYTAQEAAALLFGGVASDYAISTIDNQVANINNLAHVDGWGDGQYLTGTVAENFSLDSGPPGYNDPFGGPSYSAYVLDHSCFNRYSNINDVCAAGEPGVNYAFRINAVPEPATWALMITGFGLVGATLRRRRTVAA